MNISINSRYLFSNSFIFLLVVKSAESMVKRVKKQDLKEGIGVHYHLQGNS